MTVQLPLSILIYHRVRARADPLFPDEVDAARFARHLALLARWFQVLPLEQAVERLRQGRLPPRAACITFDDGYADNAEVALPLLLRFRMHATFFIASDFLDGGTMWNDAVIEVVREAPGQQLNLVRSGFGHHDVGSLDKRRALIQTLIGALKYLPPAERLGRVCSMARRFTPLMLSTDQVLALHRAGMAIGAHTASHPILSALPDSQARTEIAAGRAALEQIIQAPVRLFAYPNGKPGQDFEERHAEMLREQGFDAAVTTAWGAARSGSDPFRLPRFTPWDRSAPGFLLRMARNLMTHPA